ncbi:uncharacterized protein MELLADRAFT_68038 [Melampsora larici-populina 98AG31]|uniref:Uncharacterized protein n=1 Tax=Melampsora larici-populina (strain 98AG31 / pathotype 3-4-7) TaxID=747676 RepID=F4S5C8_MELLP|nr:uncharacterized protein MELLADRAFT_68038 [Melampsora larici-populina 98AG31]EGG00145.1 hypothetical protein MELLADRAFT_68038 [Melampsora larici-populina 98AG31]
MLHHPENNPPDGLQEHSNYPIFTVPNDTNEDLHINLDDHGPSELVTILTKMHQEEKDYSNLLEKLNVKHHKPLLLMYTCAHQGKKIISKHLKDFDDFEVFLKAFGHQEKKAVLDLYPAPNVLLEKYPAVWKLENIVFPTFIHKLEWFYYWFDQGNIHTSFSTQDLSTLRHSAYSFFKSWAEKVSSLFHETLKNFILKTQNHRISHFGNSFDPQDHTQVILQLEYGPSSTNWETLSWELLRKWLLINHFDLYQILNSRITRFKQLHGKSINQSIHLDKLEHIDYTSFCKKVCDLILLVITMSAYLEIEKLFPFNPSTVQLSTFG